MLAKLKELTSLFQEPERRRKRRNLVRNVRSRATQVALGMVALALIALIAVSVWNLSISKSEHDIHVPFTRKLIMIPCIKSWVLLVVVVIALAITTYVLLWSRLKRSQKVEWANRLTQSARMRQLLKDWEALITVIGFTSALVFEEEGIRAVLGTQLSLGHFAEAYVLKPVECLLVGLLSYRAVVKLSYRSLNAYKLYSDLHRDLRDYQNFVELKYIEGRIQLKQIAGDKQIEDLVESAYLAFPLSWVTKEERSHKYREWSRCRPEMLQWIVLDPQRSVGHAPGTDPGHSEDNQIPNGDGFSVVCPITEEAAQRVIESGYENPMNLNRADFSNGPLHNRVLLHSMWIDYDVQDNEVGRLDCLQATLIHLCALVDFTKQRELDLLFAGPPEVRNLVESLGFRLIKVGEFRPGHEERLYDLYVYTFKAEYLTKDVRKQDPDKCQCRFAHLLADLSKADYTKELREAWVQRA